MEPHTLFFRFGVALGIGILVGLQREYAFDDPDREMFAGVRTFALMGLGGCTAAYLADLLGNAWVFIGSVILMGLLITIAYFVTAWQRNEVGLTTEVAAMLTILAGALSYLDQIALAAALGVATTVLLALKLEVRTFVRRITREDLYATLRFAVITAIILPVLPNQTYGPPPLDVINPYKIWLMVILISGISFLGYVLIQLVGTRQGIGLTGFLGGLASSTAVTLSFTQRSEKRVDLARPFALAITIAWTMMFPRILFEVAVVNIELFRVLWPPLVAAGVAGLVYCVYLYFSQRVDEEGKVTFSNPFDLWPSISFGLFFAFVLVVSRAAQVYFGTTGIYLSSLFAGLADVDAISLSMAQLSSQAGGLELTVAERAIVLAAMSNTAVKGGMVMLIGSRTLQRAILPGLLMILVVGIGFAFLL